MIFIALKIAIIHIFLSCRTLTSHHIARPCPLLLKPQLSRDSEWKWASGSSVQCKYLLNKLLNISYFSPFPSPPLIFHTLIFNSSIPSPSLPFLSLLTAFPFPFHFLLFLSLLYSLAGASEMRDQVWEQTRGDNGQRSDSDFFNEMMALEKAVLCLH